MDLIDSIIIIDFVNFDVMAKIGHGGRYLYLKVGLNPQKIYFLFSAGMGRFEWVKVFPQ